MSATVAAVLKKIAIYILGDEKKRGKLFALIGSIAAGFIGLMCLPVAVLSSMGSLEIETPEVDRSMFTDSAFMATLDEDQQSQIAEFQSQGEAIAAFMSAVGLPSETIKAQLIYYSYFDENPLSDFTEYASLFANANDDWFCQYHLTHFIRTRIMQRERYDHSRAFFELPEAAHRWRCRFFC